MTHSAAGGTEITSMSGAVLRKTTAEVLASSVAPDATRIWVVQSEALAVSLRRELRPHGCVDTVVAPGELLARLAHMCSSLEGRSPLSSAAVEATAWMALGGTARTLDRAREVLASDSTRRAEWSRRVVSAGWLDAKDVWTAWGAEGKPPVICVTWDRELSEHTEQLLGQLAHHGVLQRTVVEPQETVSSVGSDAMSDPLATKPQVATWLVPTKYDAMQVALGWVVSAVEAGNGEDLLVVVDTPTSAMALSRAAAGRGLATTVVGGVGADTSDAQRLVALIGWLHGRVTLVSTWRALGGGLRFDVLAELARRAEIGRDAGKGEWARVAHALGEGWSATWCANEGIAGPDLGATIAAWCAIAAPRTWSEWGLALRQVAALAPGAEGERLALWAAHTMDDVASVSDGEAPHVGEITKWLVSHLDCRQGSVIVAPVGEAAQIAATHAIVLGAGRREWMGEEGKCEAALEGRMSVHVVGSREGEAQGALIDELARWCDQVEAPPLEQCLTSAGSLAIVEPVSAAGRLLRGLAANKSLPWRVEDAAAQNGVVGRAATVERARRSGALTPWDGRLAASIMPAVISPTALEQWVKCPHAFFARNVIRIRSEGSGSAGSLSPGNRERGIVVHRAVEKLGAATGALPDRIAHSVERSIAEVRSQVPFVTDIAWEVESVRLTRALTRLCAIVPEVADPGTRHEEWVRVRLADLGVEGEESIRGRFDVLAGAGSNLHLFDIKSGSVHSATVDSHYDHGESLQLPLYAALVAQSLGVEDGDVSRAFLEISTLQDPKVHSLEMGERAALMTRQTLTTIVDGMRQGLVPATPGTPGKGGVGEHCQFCDYDRSCPTNRIARAGRKRRDPNMSWHDALRAPV